MFNEKNEEYSTKQAKNIPVWKNPKYEEAKNKAIELINSDKYNLTEGDFWILMNETKSGKMGYTGLIISHNGCLKINDNLDNKFKPECVKIDKEGYNNSLVFIYQDEEIYEIGEVNAKNCKNEYSYAMAYKRCFDRVVLKKSKLAYAGVYSDSEADEFSGKDIEMPKNNEIRKEDNKENEKISEKKVKALETAIDNRGIKQEQVSSVLAKYKYNTIKDIEICNYMTIVEQLSDLVQ